MKKDNNKTRSLAVDSASAGSVCQSCGKPLELETTGEEFNDETWFACVDRCGYTCEARICWETAKMIPEHNTLTDKQRIDWLLQECELRRLDANGAPVGNDLMDRNEIDAEIQAQNIPVTSTAPN